MANIKAENMDVRCRTCLSVESTIIPINKMISIENEDIALLELIMVCASVQISPEDPYPHIICEKCVELVQICYTFRRTCEQSRDILLEEFNRFIQNEMLKPEVKLNATSIIDATSDNDSVVNDFGTDHLNLNIPVDLLTLKDEFAKDSYTNDLNKSHEQLECVKCDNNFITVRSLRTHFRRCHAKPRKKDKLKPTEIDHVITGNTKTSKLIRTVRKARLKNGTTGKKEQRKSKTRDNFTATKSNHLHKTNRQLPRKIKCKFCDFMTDNTQLIGKHLHTEHSHLKSHQCTLCPKSFFNINSLNVHTKTHTGIRNFVCETCGLSFASFSNMKTHRRVHTGEKPYTCKTCGKCYTHHTSLRSHESTHKHTKDHVCSMCGAAFVVLDRLQIHMKRHATERQYKCHACDKSFLMKQGLKRHIFTHTGIKNYVCSECGKAFNRKSNLQVHMCIHTGETPFICSACGKGFIQNHCLRAHMIRYHKSN